MLLSDPEYAANMSTDVGRISSEDGSSGNWKVVPPQHPELFANHPYLCLLGLKSAK